MGFVAAEILLLLACVSALIALGVGSLESRMGITRDGIGIGKRAPMWQARDLAGQVRRGPHGSSWQVLVFADQELAVFQDLRAGLNRIHSSDSDIEVLLLSPRSKEICDVIADSLAISVPMIPAAEDLYGRFRVRVKPFVHVIDPHGVVRAKGVANYEVTLRAFVGWARSQGSASSSLSMAFPS